MSNASKNITNIFIYYTMQKDMAWKPDLKKYLSLDDISVGSQSEVRLLP